jgi:hypothetical protein
VTINLDEEGILINLDGKLSMKGDTISRNKIYSINGVGA